jgi:sortase B
MKNTHSRAAPRHLAIKLIGAAAGLALLISGAYMVNYGLQGARSQRISQELARLIHDPENLPPLALTTAPGGGGTAGEAPTEEPPPPPLPGMQTLIDRNADACGWLYLPAAEIDYPVARHSDNDYYLSHDFSGAKNKFGCLFADKDTILDANSTENVAIYGHAMATGAMLGRLGSYRELWFLKANPAFSYTDLYRRYSAEIFAVFITNADPVQDSGRFFEWRQSSFSDEAAFDSWLSQAQKRSLYKGLPVPEYTDRLLTLTTCAFDFKEARLVICARLTEADEPPPDVSGYAGSADPLFPQAWYDRYGGVRPV